MLILVTGSTGLIGSEATLFFSSMGMKVIGLDNDMRADFFGPQGSTKWMRDRLEQKISDYQHSNLDIRDRKAISDFFKDHAFDAVIHCAAQPSHDLAASRPYDDFDVNAVGTLNLLEACRQYCPEAVFCQMSTNKVYGDGPNHIENEEQETRYDFTDPAYLNGIAEDFPIDHCLHSLFGASKVAGDVMAQEYGRYFGMKVGVFRGGCLTGPNHSGVELHGFLNYIFLAAVREADYTVFGYKGKQVRDQIHSHDVCNVLWKFIQNPRAGEVYNLGGGKKNSASLLECVNLIEQATGKRPSLTFSETNRIGDHICYYSDLRKLKKHFPDWELTYSIPEIIEDMAKNFHDNEKK